MRASFKSRFLCLSFLLALGSSSFVKASDPLDGIALLALTDEELFLLAVEKDDDCYLWFAQARRARTEFFPENDPWPKEFRYKYIRDFLLMIGPDALAETSPGYQMSTMMLEMSSGGVSDAETALAVYNHCIRFDPRHVGLPGAPSHPHPQLRQR